LIVWGAAKTDSPNHRITAKKQNPIQTVKIVSTARPASSSSKRLIDEVDRLIERHLIFALATTGDYLPAVHDHVSRAPSVEPHAGAAELSLDS
jgi:hypothetical protein